MEESFEFCYNDFMIKIIFTFILIGFTLMTPVDSNAMSCGDAVKQTRRAAIAEYLNEIYENDYERKYLTLEEVITLYRVKKSKIDEFRRRVAEEEASGIMWEENPRLVGQESMAVRAFNKFTGQPVANISYSSFLEREP